MCCAVTLSVPAQADQYDFISQLDNSGVSYQSSQRVSVDQDIIEGLAGGEKS
jgi:hypothetical protein